MIRKGSGTHMDEHIDYENIFTPQGMLGHVSKHPNLDFLMNIFNIPRVYGVSGFGTWNVGQHTMAVAFLALYWSAFNSYPFSKLLLSKRPSKQSKTIS